MVIFCCTFVVQVLLKRKKKSPGLRSQRKMRPAVVRLLQKIHWRQSIGGQTPYCLVVASLRWEPLLYCNTGWGGVTNVLLWFWRGLWLLKIFLHMCTLESSIIWSKSALNARCKLCRRKGDGEKMLLCDMCDRGHHMYCLKPPVKVCLSFTSLPHLCCSSSPVLLFNDLLLSLNISSSGCRKYREVIGSVRNVVQRMSRPDEFLVADDHS